jgi:hypothetical protein
MHRDIHGHFVHLKLMPYFHYYLCHPYAQIASTSAFESSVKLSIALEDDARCEVPIAEGIPVGSHTFAICSFALSRQQWSHHHCSPPGLRSLSGFGTSSRE